MCIPSAPRSPTKSNAFIESLRAEGEAVEAEAPAAAAKSAPSVQTAVAALTAAEPVTIVIEEKLLCQLKKDGGLESMEVQGTMMLEVNNDDDAFCRVQISGGLNKALQFKTHPNIDKALHANSNVLGLKDASRPFPTGSALGILKWRMQAKDESSVPLSINCWPSVSGTQSFVSIEYEASEVRAVAAFTSVASLGAAGCSALLFLAALPCAPTHAHARPRPPPAAPRVSPRRGSPRFASSRARARAQGMDLQNVVIAIPLPVLRDPPQARIEPPLPPPCLTPPCARSSRIEVRITGFC